MERFIFSNIGDGYKKILELTRGEVFITTKTINHIIKQRGYEKGKYLLRKAPEILRDPTEVLPNYRSGRIISDEFWFIKINSNAVIVIIEITKSKNGLDIKTILDKSIKDLNRIKRRIQESGGRPILPITSV